MTDASPANRNERILVIDDNCAIHEDFRKILGEPDPMDAALQADELAIFGTPPSAGYEIRSAFQGEEGLKLVEQSLIEGQPFAMAFIDMRMPPGWDGIETIKRIWQICPDLQVVICTAYADCSWVEVQEQIQPRDRLLILKKPFDTIEVLQLANALTEKWRLLQESKLKMGDLELLVAQRTSELEVSRTDALRMMEEALRHKEKAEQAYDDFKREVSQRQKLEEQFREQASLLDKARDAIFVRDLEHRITYWNKSAEQLYGWTAEEAHGRSALDLLHKDAVAFQAACMELRKTGEWVGEFGKTNKAGRDLIIESRWTLVRNAAGSPTSVLVINTDVTARKASEEVLRMHGRILESMSEGVTVCSGNGVICFSNAACDAMFGYSDGEMTGKPFSAVLHGSRDENRRFLDEWAEHLQDQACLTEELKCRKKDGSLFLTRSRTSVLEFAGTRSFVTLFEDITEKKAMETHMLRSQRMESVGRLSSGIAHDFNNILTPVMMAAFMLRGPLPPEELENALNTIETSTRRGADLIRQLLTFGRGGMGSEAVVNPGSILRDVVEIIRGTFPKNIVLEARTIDGGWPVLGDVTQLHQVLLNLCVNARDAMSHGGTLTLSTENLRLDENYASMNPQARPGPYLVLRVADTGEGIPPEIIDKIFDPFFTTKDTGKGTGLGLSTVLGIVESHHGFVKARSQVKHGTTFEVYLPAATEAIELAAAEEPPAPPHGNGETILVVDDEPGIRSITGKALMGYGYKVITAADGAEGIALFCQNQNEIKAVLTDIMMPHMDGVTMSRILKRMNPSLKIVASSGMGSIRGREETAGELQALGVETLLSKPYTADTILSALGTALASCEQAAR